MQTATQPDFSRLIAHGHRGIDPARHDEIIADITAAGFEIQWEDWGTFTLTIHLGPQPPMYRPRRIDREEAIMRKWGNPPHNVATEFTTYRFVFHAND